METTEREKGVITEILATMDDKESAPVSVGLLRHVARDADALEDALEGLLVRMEMERQAVVDGGTSAKVSDFVRSMAVEKGYTVLAESATPAATD